MQYSCAIRIGGLTRSRSANALRKSPPMRLDNFASSTIIFEQNDKGRQMSSSYIPAGKTTARSEKSNRCTRRQRPFHDLSESLNIVAVRQTVFRLTHPSFIVYRRILYHDVQREAYFIIAYLFAEGVLFRPLVNCRRLMYLQVCLVSTSFSRHS